MCTACVPFVRGLRTCVLLRSLQIFSLLIATARGGEASRNVTDQARTKLTNLGARARVLVAGLVLLTAVVVYVMGARLGWGVDTQLSGLRMHFAASVLGINATDNMENSTEAETSLPVNGTRQRHHDPHAVGWPRFSPEMRASKHYAELSIIQVHVPST